MMVYTGVLTPAIVSKVPAGHHAALGVGADLHEVLFSAMQLKLAES